MRYAKLWKFALAIVVVYFITGVARADEPGDVRGCYVTYISQSGKFLYEPFLKVADKSSTDEEGNSEIWGFRPWNLEPPDHDGKTHPVNISADRFIPVGVLQEVPAGTMKRRIKCPDGIW